MSGLPHLSCAFVDHSEIPVNKVGFAFVALLIFLALPSGLLASSIGPIPAENNETSETFTLEPVVVAASKLHEKDRHVPGSVTILTSKEIENTGIKESQDLNGYIPNFRFWTFGNRGGIGVMNIRGLFNQNQADTAVTMYIDDVPHSDLHSFDMPLYGVEQIEVLSGPQGTLFGKNTQGGVINIVTKKPGDTPEILMNIEGGSYRSRSARAWAGGPVMAGKVFISVSGLADARNGWLRNTYTGTDIGERRTLSGKVQARWLPSDKWEVLYTAAIEDYDDTGGHFLVPIDKTGYTFSWLPAYYGMLGRPVPSVGLRAFEVWQDCNGKSKTDADRQSLRITGSASRFDVTSVTTWRNRNLSYSMDGDLTPLDFETYHTRHHLEEWSQELRIQSPRDQTVFQWLVGAFYDHRRERFKTWYELGTDYPAVVLGLVPHTSQDVTVDANFGDKTRALFGQASYRIFTERVGLTAGLRYEEVKKEMNRQHYFVVGGRIASLREGYPLVYGGTTSYPGGNSDSTSFREWLPKFIVDFRIMPEHMIYVSTARGYKPGGFDYRADNPGSFRFVSETSWTYEAGAKTQWLGNRVRLNLAAFYTRVSNYQDIISYDAYTLSYRNVGRAVIRGIETSAVFRPVNGFELAANAGIVDAAYRDYIDPATGVDYSGKAIVLTPRYNFGVAAQYRFTVGLYLRGEMIGYGRSYSDQANRNGLATYTLLNARIGYKVHAFDIYAYGKNLTNREYFVMGVGNLGIVGEPLMIGMGVTLTL